MKAKQLFCKLGACSEAVKWVGDRTYAKAWRDCQRGDWLLWITARMIGKRGWPTHQQVVLAACACAETALKYAPAGETRPAEAIEIARKWTRGEATIGEVRTAAKAANAAYAAANYAACAANAAYFARAESLASSADICREMLEPKFAKEEGK